MAVSSYEIVKVQGEYITADLLVWRRYKRPYYGITEALLEANPHLALIHAEGPFIPPGTQVLIPIDLDIINQQARVGPTVMLYGRTE